MNRKRVVITKDEKIGFIYELDFINSKGIDKIPVYLMDGIEPTGKKIYYNPASLSLLI
jgi:hypothetical protein